MRTDILFCLDKHWQRMRFQLQYKLAEHYKIHIFFVWMNC